ncbi:MAG: glycoside hydrolase family 130 protein [Acidimicrobiia bacterium]|nr:glycoside hydrolase family 130 protein [Acidimicrobiia bacterium]MDH3397194.1 glycoside hydrolase family 130 protein [Acidimicrobiia bacterium]
MNPIPVTRTAVRLVPDPHRVITKPFLPGEQVFPDGQSRAALIIKRILAMPEREVASTLAATQDRFADRHEGLNSILESDFAVVADHVDNPQDVSWERRLLIGAYFTHEYSIEAASLSNPSMVPAPDQVGLDPGELRFVMSLRAIGEGHISSIEFRSGVIDARGKIMMDKASRYATTARHRSPLYDKPVLSTKLEELGAFNDITRMCLDPLPSLFTFEQLEAAILDLDRQGVDRAIAFQTVKVILWLASSNYASTFPADSEISERVIFPTGPTESHGMEDARFVRFTHDDGTVVYYATYTAFDGVQILPQLIETPDFVSFRVNTLNGSAAQNKGIALFPRKIDGRFAALSRQDNENNFLMLSDNVRFWHEIEKIQEPVRPWELVQLGNCGSPLETEAGWLVITHGVGPLRRYSLGAILLDAQDPRRVIGHLNEPLLEPDENERDGYVPNVVYSCGSMIHDNHLVLPYGFSDVGAGIATVPLDELLTRLTEK